jgi:hypothetical protein
MRSSFSCLLFIPLLVGCAGGVTTEPVKTALKPAEGIAFEAICEGEEDCDTYWERAQIWVARHSKMKIQTSTETLVQTYEAQGASGSTYYFTVSKEPLEEENEYRIVMEAACSGTMCSPKIDEVYKAFYYYVTTGEDLLVDVKDGLISIK